MAVVACANLLARSLPQRLRPTRRARGRRIAPTYNRLVVSPRSVSVVIPNYNRGPLLRAAVASALDSGDVEVEVLVCDDGSSDGSKDVVREIGDERVRWLPGARSGGPAGPRNRGIRAAGGEWVAFLDSDDTWVRGKLAAQLDEIDASGATACATNANRCLPGREEPVGTLYPLLPPTITLADQLSANLVVTSSVLVSTAKVREAGGFPERPSRTIYEDYALWLRLAQLGPICALDAPWVNYRDDSATSIRGTMGLELRCTFNALRDFADWRASRQPPVPTAWDERVRMTRQLAGLVSVRDMVARTVRRGTGRTSSA